MRLPRVISLLVPVLLSSVVRAEPPGSVHHDPAIGMFAVQAPGYWQRVQDDPGTEALSHVSPTSLFSDAGVTWVRLPLMSHLRRKKSGEWAFLRDRFVDDLRHRGIKIFGTISLGTLPDGPKRQVLFTEDPDPDQEAQWLEEVRALVRHYRDAVRVWQIGNEIEKKPYSVEAYIRMFEQGSRAIREIDPGAAIAAAGFTAGDFDRFTESTWPALVESETPPDLIDFHFHSYAGRIGLLDERLGQLTAMRDERLPDAGLIMTENSTFTGRRVPYPWENDRRITQTESDQAAELVKRAAIALGHGVSVSFGTDMDKTAWKKQAVHPFSQNGLVHNPRRTYRGHTRTWPKSAWWSLRLMTVLIAADAPVDASRRVVRLDDAPRDDIAFFRIGDGLYLAWTDRKKASRVRLEVPGIAGELARVIRAVPRGDGKRIEPESWRDRFPERTVEIRDETVTLDLSRTPVWIVAD